MRAVALPADERRRMIVEATLPLLLQNGEMVTTRQIADAAGIAEGTIFRAFIDKEEIFAAAVEKFLDPGELHERLRAIDPELPLEGKVNDILFQLRARMTGIFGIMSAVGMQGPPRGRRTTDNFALVIDEILRPDLEQLNVPPERIGSFLRLVAFASAIPHFNEGREMSTAELAQYITYGIAGHPAEGGSSNAS
jgi:AcrR family transcriptional regulator